MNILLEVLDALANTLWQAAIIAISVWLLLRLTPRMNAATRYAIWWATLGAVLLLPFAARIVSSTRTHYELARPIPPNGDLEALATPQDAIAETVLFRVTPTPTTLWPRLLLWGVMWTWATILLWRLVQILRSYLYVRGLKHRASVAPVALPRIARHAAVLVSHEIASPMAVGFLHPVILLPQSMLTDLTGTEREHALLHEAAHLARYDDWTNLGMRILGAVLALHPVAIWILRQIDREREIACDDWVVERTGAARPYAESLAHLMELRHARQRPLLTVGILGDGSRIGHRIEMLLHTGRTFSGRASRRGTLAGIVSLAVLLFGGSLPPRWIVLAQSSEPVAEWQVKAGGKMTFDVALGEAYRT